MLVWSDPTPIGLSKIVIRLLNLHLPRTQPFLLGLEIEQVMILVRMAVYDFETEKFNPVMIGTILTEKVMPDLFAVLCCGRGNPFFLASGERQQQEYDNDKSYDRRLHTPFIHS